MIQPVVYEDRTRCGPDQRSKRITTLSVLATQNVWVLWGQLLAPNKLQISIACAADDTSNIALFLAYKAIPCFDDAQRPLEPSSPSVVG